MKDMNFQEWLEKGEQPSTYFCRNRKNPMLLAGMFTGLCRQLYLDPNALFPNVKRWDPSAACDKTVYIESSSIWKDAVSDPRPAIIVDIGDLQFQPRKFEGIDQMSYFDLKEGEEWHERSVISSVVFAHLGKNKGQVVTYASNTYDLFDAFSHVIKQDFCFDLLDARSILRPRLRKADPEDWECLFQVDFQLREGYTVKVESPKLKGFVIEANTGLDNKVYM